MTSQASSVARRPLYAKTFELFLLENMTAREEELKGLVIQIDTLPPARPLWQDAFGGP
ncbi:MAG: hypothetical protein ACP5HS_08550 [Anaerolineae bacterium]